MHMMKYNHMVSNGGWSEGMGIIISLVILADLILLGVWLFQKVTKK